MERQASLFVVPHDVSRSTVAQSLPNKTVNPTSQPPLQEPNLAQSDSFEFCTNRQTMLTPTSEVLRQRLVAPPALVRGLWWAAYGLWLRWTSDHTDKHEICTHQKQETRPLFLSENNFAHSGRESWTRKQWGVLYRHPSCARWPRQSRTQMRRLPGWSLVTDHSTLAHSVPLSSSSLSRKLTYRPWSTARVVPDVRADWEDVAAIAGWRWTARNSSTSPEKIWAHSRFWELAHRCNCLNLCIRGVKTLSVYNVPKILDTGLHEGALLPPSLNTVVTELLEDVAQVSQMFGFCFTQDQYVIKIADDILHPLQYHVHGLLKHWRGWSHLSCNGRYGWGYYALKFAFRSAFKLHQLHTGVLNYTFPSQAGKKFMKMQEKVPSPNRL